MRGINWVLWGATSGGTPYSGFSKPGIETGEVMNARGSDFSVSSDGVYVSEASQLCLSNIPNILHVEGLDGVVGVRSFGLVGHDTSGGDVMGWRYVEVGKDAKLLIIND